MAFYSRNSLATCWSYNQELGGGGGAGGGGGGR